MYLLDAKVRRRMCKKVLEVGGNAVLAYRQNFDMEGERTERELELILICVAIILLMRTSNT